MKKITLLFLSFFIYSINFAQVSNYTFSQSNVTYTPIAGGTVLGVATNDDTSFNALNIGFSFNYGGVNFTQVSVNSNGFLTFDATATSSYLSLSNTGFGANNNVIAGFNDDLQGIATSSLSYVTTGTAPNRVFTVQWTNYRNYIFTGTTTDSYNFQIKLYETSNLIDFVYGSMVKDATNRTRQVGLRGASSAVFNNRTTVTNWAATTQGTINTDSCALTSTVLPSSGLTFTWTPPNCAAPTALNVAPLTTTSATINWTASASASSGYQYVLSTTNTAPTGAGTAISAVTVTLNTLTPNTNYYFFIRSNCGSGNFSGWVSIPFFTGYCVPSSTSALTYINSFSTSGGSSNITNNLSGYTTGGYQNNYSTTGVSAFAGGTISYSFTLVAGSDAGVAIWIDWNKNLNFELSERVYNSNSYILDGTYTGSISVPSTATLGDYTMRIRTDYNATSPDPCAVSFNRTEAEDYKVTIISAPNDAMDFNNIQWVTDGTNGSNTSLTVPAGTPLTAYAEGYEAGVTEAAGAGTGVEAWIASSTTNTNPSTWPASAWVAATYVDNQGNNDNFSRALTLPVGTNYVASRWRLNNAAFTYGGYNGTWNGTTNNSIQVIVSPIANDECSGAIPFAYNDTLCNGTNNNGTNVNSTASAVPNPTCFNYGQNDVWYSFVVPAGVATVDVSTDFAGGTLVDTEIALYGGTCGALNFIACDQDSGTTVLSNGSSYNSKITNAAVTAGQTYYVRVSGYSATDTGTFCLKASTNTLSNDSFDAASFKFYPNPVKDVLNLSYSSVISKVIVVNLLGQEVFTKDLDSTENQIDLSTLSSGTYLVKVTSEGLVKTIKVIKE